MAIPFRSGAGEPSSGKPKRLRPWLENLLNQNEIPGLCWIDQDRTMFKIPWKHRGKQDWSPDHSRIFKEWAIQTGRYQDGQAEDYPTWKTRLRCAFNKAPDIEEVRDKRCIDSSEPYRIYRFKPAPTTVPSCTATADYGSHSAHPHTNYGEMYNYQTGTEVAPNAFDGSNDAYIRTATWCSQQPFDCSEVPLAFNDAIGEDSTQYNNHKRIKLDVVCDDYKQNFNDQVLGTFASPNALRDTPVQKSPKLTTATAAVSPLKLDTDIKPTIARAVDIRSPDEGVAGEFRVIVRYCGRTLFERTINSPTGCYICFNPTTLSRLLAPKDSELIELPACASSDKFPSKNGDKIQSIMDELLKRGLAQPLFIRCSERNIYVYRTCQCATYYYKQEVGSPGRTRGDRKPIKIQRTDVGQTETPTCVFDYASYVLALKDYSDERDSKPDPYCRLVFGQEVPYNRVDESGVLISVLVATTRALEDLNKTDALMSQRTPEVHLSESTELDRLMHEIKEMEFNQSTEHSRGQQFEPSSIDIDNADYSLFFEIIQYSPTES